MQRDGYALCAVDVAVGYRVGDYGICEKRLAVRVLWVRCCAGRKGGVTDLVTHRSKEREKRAWATVWI